jgi:hypothetical protein
MHVMQDGDIVEVQDRVSFCQHTSHHGCSAGARGPTLKRSTDD